MTTTLSETTAADRKKLLVRIDAAQKQADAAKKTAKAAKHDFRQAKEIFKDAKRSAKKLRKLIKALKADLVALTAKKIRPKPAVKKAPARRPRPEAAAILIPALSAPAPILNDVSTAASAGRTGVKL